MTSARLVGRATGGFSAYLAGMEGARPATAEIGGWRYLEAPRNHAELGMM
jgi:hypothetical protein